MNVDHRLHHAARELRSIEIDVPPLGATPRRRPIRLVAALAVPMLFAAGGLFAIGATGPEPARSVHSDIALASAAPVDVGSSPAVSPDPARDEPVVAHAASTASDTNPATSAGAAVDIATGDAPGAPSVRVELELIAELLNNPRPSAPAAEATPATAGDTIGPI